MALADDTELQPDLLVAPRSQFTDKELLGPPLLAVEVLSPSTRRIDLLLKRDRLQAEGAPSYWLVDPDEPSVTVLELLDGACRELAVVEGDQTWNATLPFPVTVAPADLLRRAQGRPITAAVHSPDVVHSSPRQPRTEGRHRQPGDMPSRQEHHDAHDDDPHRRNLHGRRAGRAAR